MVGDILPVGRPPGAWAGPDSDASYSFCRQRFPEWAIPASPEPAVTPDDNIDIEQLDALTVRYPNLPRSRIALAMETYGKDQDELERALRGLAAAEAARANREGRQPPA